MKEKSVLHDRVHVVIFAAMFLFLCAQFSNVMVYFDDYAYYSLSYGADYENIGHNFSLPQLAAFLHEHYYTCNGRLLGFGIWLSLFSIGGLPLVQIAAAVFTLLVLITLWKLVDIQEHRSISALLICAFYGLFSVHLIRHGIYWFAAFFQYVAPISGMIGFILLYFRYRQIGFRLPTVVLMALLILFAAFSQEQFGVTVCFMLFLLIVFEVWQKNFRKELVVFAIFAVLGVSALMLSPGILNRASGPAVPLLSRIVASTYMTIHTFFAKMATPFIVLLFISVFSFSAELIQTDEKILKVIDTVAILLSIISIAIYCCTPVLSLLGGIFENRYHALFVIGSAAVCLIVLQITRYYFTNQKYSRLLVFLSAVGSVGCLCVLPEVPERLFIPTWFLLFPTLMDGVLALCSKISTKKGIKESTCISVLTAVIVCFAIYNAQSIYKGYAENGIVHRYNDRQLTQVAALEDSGEQVDAVYLKMLPNKNCTGVMVYVDGVQFIKNWICDYYDLSHSVSFYFSSDGVEDNPNAYRNLGNGVYVK